MENIPFCYVVCFLMELLNEREKEKKIEVKSLLLITKELINLLPYEEETINQWLEEFDFKYELENLLNDYSEYFEFEDNYLILKEDVSDEELSNILDSFIDEYQVEFLEDIDSVIDDNYIFLDLLGIKIEKKVHGILLDLEKKIEKMYSELSYNRKNDKFMRELKLLVFKRNVIFMYINNNLDADEIYDLYLYSYNIACNSDFPISINFELDDLPFDKEIFAEDSILRSLFYKEDLAMFNISDRLNNDIIKLANEFEDGGYSKIKFYLTFLMFLEEEISSANNKSLLNEFRESKYRFMNALDTTYGTLTFIDNRDYDNILKTDFKEDYSFMKNMVIYFINEILEYDDSKYYYNKEEFYNLVNYYFNTIKKLFIKTYYYLTGDNMVISTMKSNPLYNVNKISTELLNSTLVVDKKERKKKIKN